MFDSGIGGKLIAQKIHRTLPQATVIFKSDSDFFPYGDKPQSFILRRSIAMTQKLIKESCQLIVVACNAATTNTIKSLRQKFPQLTFVGIEPPIKPIVALTHTGKVAVMGTPATINSHRYQVLTEKFAGQTKIYDIACPGLAEKIEAIIRQRHPLRYYQVSKSEFNFQNQLAVILDNCIAAGVNSVGLACTHYPYLLKQMKAYYPHVTFYDPAAAVVKQVKKLALSPSGVIIERAS